MPEQTGILKGTGAKVKADISDAAVTFRGAVKATAAFSELDAEARGTLLVLRYKGHIIELAAGKKALPFAQRIQRAAKP